MLEQIDQNNFIEVYQKFYFKENTSTSKINIRNTTPRSIEEYIENKLRQGIIDVSIVAWKAGTLDFNTQKPKLKNGNYLNGYGKIIIKDRLEEYLNSIDKAVVKKALENNDLEKAYSYLLHNVPNNFGSVYIINLMYFISQGKCPIYDRFAHKALKALFFNVAPCEVYVGPAPAKSSIKDVINMYREYIALLKIVFGKSCISRDLDRALWVYGHNDIKYEDHRLRV